ncbi:hypothetical protein AURDEDRAFT_173127 [Auricularia subglabra TFB-10046 SS5]|nr:hypothetical protein AURDEDRAFT_173127 [Auricularia subglabra TFB-10046 SS5]
MAKTARKRMNKATVEATLKSPRSQRRPRRRADASAQAAEPAGAAQSSSNIEPTLGADLVHLVPASTLRQSTPGDVLPAAPPAVLEQVRLPARAPPSEATLKSPRSQRRPRRRADASAQAAEPAGAAQSSSNIEPTLGADLVHLVPASTLRQSTPGDVLPAAPPAVLEQPMLDEPPRPADAATAGVSVVCEPASGVDSRPEPHPQPALESESNVVQVQDAPAPAPDLDDPQLAPLASPELPRSGIRGLPTAAVEAAIKSPRAQRRLRRRADMSVQAAEPADIEPTLGADLVHLVPAFTRPESTPGDVLPASPPAVLEHVRLPARADAAY